MNQLNAKECQDLLTFFLEFVINNLLIPGQVENWVLIADMSGLNVLSVPYSVLSNDPDVQRDLHVHAKQLPRETVQGLHPQRAVDLQRSLDGCEAVHRGEHRHQDLDDFKLD